MRIVSVRLSVCQTQTEGRYAQIFIPYERSFSQLPAANLLYIFRNTGVMKVLRDDFVLVHCSLYSLSAFMLHTELRTSVNSFYLQFSVHPVCLVRWIEDEIK